MAKYFISHSAKDKEIVNEFLDIFEVFPIPEGDIFCTSREGDDITTGDDFVKAIKDELSDAEYVFACFSQCYIDSTVCMAELGAGWIKEEENETRVIPIIIDKNFPFDSTTPLFRNIQGVNALDENSLIKFFEEVISPDYSGNYTIKLLRKIDKFLKFIDTEELQEPNKVPYSEYQNLKKRNNTLENENKELKEEVEFYKKKSERLSKAETQEKKDEILKEYNQDTNETFNNLLERIKTELDDLPRMVRKAVFVEYSLGEIFHYNSKTSDIRKGIEYQYLKDEGDGEYPLNGNNPKIKILLEDLETLESLESPCNEEYSKTYGDSYFTNKEFWEDVFDTNF